MLKIRLRRAGKRHQPTYRVVVVEHTAPTQGSYLEAIGTYNPRARQFAVNQDRVLHWLNHGAQPSERMAKLLVSAGVSHKLIVLPDYNRKPKRTAKKAAPEAAVHPTAAAEEAPAADAASTPAETAAETELAANPEPEVPAEGESTPAAATPVETDEAQA